MTCQTAGLSNDKGYAERNIFSKNAYIDWKKEYIKLTTGRIYVEKTFYLLMNIEKKTIKKMQFLQNVFCARYHYKSGINISVTFYSLFYINKCWYIHKNILNRYLYFTTITLMQNTSPILFITFWKNYGKFHQKILENIFWKLHIPTNIGVTHHIVLLIFFT